MPRIRPIDGPRPSRVTFCATSRSGLGHLRRLSWIASALRASHPEMEIDLVTNAEAKRVPFSLDVYGRILAVERADMAAALASNPPSAVVIDTAVLPGVERVPSPRCLILRKVSNDHLERFRLRGTPWDLVLTPHPAHDWTPELPPSFARRHEAVGWIFESASIDLAWGKAGGSRGEARRVLVTTGGGGADQAEFHERVRSLIAALRDRFGSAIEVVLVRGPREAGSSQLDADRTLMPAAGIRHLLGEVDLVVSAVGYNTILELAQSDVPVVLIPLPRTFDDQFDRARAWGSALGCADLDGPIEPVARWAAEILATRTRRGAVSLGESGASRSADLIAELACTAI